SVRRPRPATFVIELPLTAPRGIRAPVAASRPGVDHPPRKLTRTHDRVDRCRPRWDLSHDSDPSAAIRFELTGWVGMGRVRTGARLNRRFFLPATKNLFPNLRPCALTSFFVSGAVRGCPRSRHRDSVEIGEASCR